MNTVKELHNHAMILLQEAIVFNHNGDTQSAKNKFKEAFVLESEAADLVSKNQNSEPTRSILYRSAASLAYQSDDFNKSLNLIGKCLSGNPTSKIKDEVRILYESINFKMYLEQKKLILADDEFDFHLAGNLISNGLIFYKEFNDRITSLMQIIKKTSQRMFNKNYKSTTEIFSPVLHPISGGSFSITIKIAYNKNQQYDMFINPSTVIDEIIDCFSFVQNEQEEELSERINDESYYNHFISSSKKIAPDGEDITGVDFISKSKEINFSRISDSIKLPSKNIVEKPKPDKLEDITISGILDLASSKQGEDEFAEVTDDNGNTYKIVINDGLDDYVRSYYKTRVTIEGKYDGHSLVYMSNMK